MTARVFASFTPSGVSIVLDSGATQRGFEASVPVDGIWAEHAYNQQYAAPL